MKYVNKYKGSWRLLLILILILPMIYYINYSASVFIGGLLIIATLMCAVFYDWKITGIYFLLSMSINILNTCQEGLCIEQGLLRTVIFLVTMLFAILCGQLINRFILKFEEANRKSIDFVKSLILTFVQVIDEKDNYLKDHSKNVCRYTRKIAEKLFEDEQLVEEIALAALLHDIGKLSVPDNILNKSGKLNEEEWIEIQRHSINGVRIIKEIPQLKFAEKYIQYHHVYYDGTGYPNVINEHEVPEEVGIILIADAYDAMTSNRPYRTALSHEQAIAEIDKYSGIQFNPKYVSVLKSLNLDEYNLIDEEIDINFTLLFSEEKGLHSLF